MRETVREEMRSVKSSDAEGWLLGCPRGLWNSWERTCSCVLNQSMVFLLAWGLGRLQQGTVFECDVWHREFEGFNGDKTQIWRVIFESLSYKMLSTQLPFKVKEWRCWRLQFGRSDICWFWCSGIYLHWLADASCKKMIDPIIVILQVHNVGMFYSISCFSCFSAFQVWWNMGLLASKFRCQLFGTDFSHV